MCNIKIGDWVKGYHSGYYQVVGFGGNYAFKDDDYYKKGEKIATMVILKQAFTSKFKFKLGADSCAIEWIKHISEDVVDEIGRFWKNNPDKKAEYDNYTAVKSLGDIWYEINIADEGIAFWQQEICTLPEKINYEQFEAWFTKRRMKYEKLYQKSKRKKKQFFITTRVIEDSIYVGKVPLYEKPVMILGK